MAKTYAGTYLYSQYSEYEKNIFAFIMNGKELDKNVEEFEDIKYEVKKRQVSNSLIKVLDSKEVIKICNRTDNLSELVSFTNELLFIQDSISNK